MVTLTEDTSDVVLSIKSADDSPTVPSITWVLPDVVTRNHVAVPEVVAATALGTVGESTPAEALPANGVPRVNDTSAVVADPPVAGCVPL